MQRRYSPLPFGPLETLVEIVGRTALAVCIGRGRVREVAPTGSGEGQAGEQINLGSMYALGLGVLKDQALTRI